MQTFAIARELLRGGRGGRCKGEKRLRMFANDELLRILECSDIAQLREELTALRINFYYQELTQFISVMSTDMPLELQQKEEELFPYSWPPTDPWPERAS